MFHPLVSIIHNYLLVFSGNKEKLFDEFKLEGRREKFSVATATSEATEENRGNVCWQDRSEDPSDTYWHLDGSQKKQEKKISWRFSNVRCCLALLRNCEKPRQVCLSAWNNWTTYGRIFMKFGTWGFFLKPVEKKQVSLKSGRKNGYFTWTPTNIYDNTSLNSSWNEKFFSQNLLKVKTHTSCLIVLFENRAFHEKMWKKYCRIGQTTDG